MSVEDQDRGLEGPLGCGTYNVYVYTRGAGQRLGEITPIQTLTWGRVRDDISSALINTAGFGPDCCELLGSLRAMWHEIVIYRNNVRVWEGPITRIGYQFDQVEIEARDVMQYVYRRILREGYDDSYPNSKTVVERSHTIIVNALTRDDPNVIDYIQRFDRDDDARESRIVNPFQKTAWEEVDDLAAKAGLDYTVLGRSIVLFDTHNILYRLPVMDDSSFMAHPIITEYGQDLVTFSAATDGMGYYGVAGGTDPYYGLVEILASSYSEDDPPDAPGPSWQEMQDATNKLAEAQYAYDVYPGLTAQEEIDLAAYQAERAMLGVPPYRQKELDALIAPLLHRKNTKIGLNTALNHAQDDYDDLSALAADFQDELDGYVGALTSQAQRNLTGHNPSPVEVRIPDDSQLNPDYMCGINQLVPGFWVPLRSTETCRQLAQWQKINAMSVSVTAGVETIGVTLTPAPHNGQDPDDVGEEE